MRYKNKESRLMNHFTMIISLFFFCPALFAQSFHESALSFSRDSAKSKTFHEERYSDGNLSRTYYMQLCSKWRFFYHHSHPSYKTGPERHFYLVRKHSIYTYRDTMVIYYPNGKKYKEICNFKKGQLYCGYRIINAWDSSGVQTLKNGTGFYTEYANNYRAEKQYEHYRLTDTVKTYRNNKLESIAVYRKGQLVYWESKSRGNAYKIIMKKRAVIRRYWSVTDRVYTKAEQRVSRRSIRQLENDYALARYEEEDVIPIGD